MKLLDLMRLALLMREIEKIVENPQSTIDLLNKHNEMMKDFIQVLQGKEKGDNKN